jgi:hypothetical protein
MVSPHSLGPRTPIPFQTIRAPITNFARVRSLALPGKSQLLAKKPAAEIPLRAIISKYDGWMVQVR